MSEVVELVEVDGLREQVKQRLLVFSNVQVKRAIDPITGLPMNERPVWAQD